VAQQNIILALQNLLQAQMAAALPVHCTVDSEAGAAALSFPGAEHSRLVWQPMKGIVSRKDPPSYLAIMNYPATVRVSQDGANLVDYWFNSKGRYSSVDVYAQNALEQRYGMFTLNINFMGHLQGLLKQEEAWSADEHGKLWTTVERQYYSYSPEEGSFSYDKTRPNLSFCSNYEDRTRKCDFAQPITKFGAEFLVGTAGGADATFAFEQVGTALNCCGGLVLVIDADVEQKKFVLQLLLKPLQSQF
jgi:hypothetical protein